jgi:hypothetical protein
MGGIRVVATSSPRIYGVRGLKPHERGSAIVAAEAATHKAAAMVAEWRRVSQRIRVEGIRVEGKEGEERFLDCADRLLRRSEVGGKSRSAPLGMTTRLGR